MAVPSQPSVSMHAGAPAPGDLVQAQDDGSADMALGFECANPWLQIESWEPEASGKPGMFT